MRRQFYLFALAFALATGAFWLTMLKEPPKSVASDPTSTAAQPLGVTIPTGLPSFEDRFTRGTDAIQ